MHEHITRDREWIECSHKPGAAHTLSFFEGVWRFSWDVDDSLHPKASVYYPPVGGEPDPRDGWAQAAIWEERAVLEAQRNLDNGAKRQEIGAVARELARALQDIRDEKICEQCSEERGAYLGRDWCCAGNIAEVVLARPKVQQALEGQL